MRKSTAFLIAMVVALGVGFFISGAALYRTGIDLVSSAFPAGAFLQSVADAIGIPYPRPIAGPAWIFGGFLVAGAFAFWLVRRAARQQVAEADPGRRGVLTGAATGAAAAITAIAGAGAAAGMRAMAGVGNEGRGWAPTFNEIFGGEVEKTSPSPRADWEGSEVKAYRRLGRTGWQISDIVIGGGRIEGDKGSDIVRGALDRGVNYIDTSPDYSGTGSENAIGNAIQGRRDQVFLATKFCTPRGHLGPNSSVEDHMAVIDESLQRLKTDYVDLVHQHSVDEIDRIESENMHEAFDRLKAQGKVRFLGFSSHTPNLVQVADASIANGRFDVMMLAYHHGIWPAMPEVIARATREQDMGIVAMKTLKGAKHHGLSGFRGKADAYSQAALRWVLSNQDVSAAIISFFEFQHLDEYLYASGGQAGPEDLALLAEYDRQIAGSYCSPHCGACLGSCPEELAIPDVLRHRMYFEDYGNQKEAMRLYANLQKSAEVCASCAAPCLGSCPVGIPIQERMAQSHDLLTLS